MRIYAWLLVSLLCAYHARAEDALTADQLRAVLVVSGDRASGTAFVAKFRGENCVITNQHVLAGQTNVKISSSDGVEFRGNRFIAATDLDLMMVVPKDAVKNPATLELAEDVSKVAAIGDDVLVPGNSKGDGVITVTPGKVTVGKNSPICTRRGMSATRSWATVGNPKMASGTPPIAWCAVWIRLPEPRSPG